MAVSPEAPALLLDADNRAAGWLPLQEAVRSGRAYAVEPAPHLLALDADAVDSRYLELTQALADTGAPTVEVTSGGAGGRRHLWLSLAPSVPDTLRAEFAAAARSLGLDARRRIRPPLSPHRSGARGVPLTPGTVPQLLAVLEGRGVTARHLSDALATLRARGVLAQGTAQAPAPLLTAPSTAPLPPELEELLRLGDVSGRYRSTSEALWSLELALANRGCSTGDALELLLTSPLWQASSKVGRAGAERWLSDDYGRALAHIRAHPRLASRPDAQELLARLEAAALRWRWARGLGVRPLSLSKSLLGVLAIARRAGVLEGLGLSCRSLSLAAGVSADTAARALALLVSEGVLSRTAPASRELAGTYALRLEHPLWQTADAATAGDAAEPGADAWRYQGALGGAAWGHLALLELEGEMSAQELAGAYGCGQAHTRRVLRRLEAAGLARRAGAGWVAVARQERSRILAQLDTGGVELWRERYSRHRQAWLAHLERREQERTAALARELEMSHAAGVAELERWQAELEERHRALEEVAA